MTAVAKNASANVSTKHFSKIPLIGSDVTTNYLKNIEEHKSVGYADACGRCLTVVPFSHINPVKMKLRAKK